MMHRSQPLQGAATYVHYKLVNPSEQQNVSTSARTQFTGCEQQPGSSRLVTLGDQDPFSVSSRSSRATSEHRELFDPVQVSFKDALHESGALDCSSQFTYFHHRRHSHQPQRARSLSDDTRVPGCVLRELHSAGRATGIVPATWRSSGHLSNSVCEQSPVLLRSASAPVLPNEDSQACGCFRQGPAAQPVSCSLIQRMQQRQQQQQQKQQRLTSSCSQCSCGDLCKFFGSSAVASAGSNAGGIIILAGVFRHFPDSYSIVHVAYSSSWASSTVGIVTILRAFSSKS